MPLLLPGSGGKSRRGVLPFQQPGEARIPRKGAHSPSFGPGPEQRAAGLTAAVIKQRADWLQPQKLLVSTLALLSAWPSSTSRSRLSDIDIGGGREERNGFLFASDLLEISWEWGQGLTPKVEWGRGG